MFIHDLTTEAGVREYLTITTGSHSSVERLSNGFSAYVFRATFDEPLTDGSKTVVVKHVKDLAAGGFAIPLDPRRMLYEYAAMTYLTPLLPRSASSLCLPTIISFDEATQTILMSDAGKLPTLKAWLTVSTALSLVQRVGYSIGSFLADVHELGPAAKSHFAGNRRAREISALVYFGELPAAAAKFGHNDSDGAIAQAAAQAEKEVLEEDEVLTIGDFWTGNVLVDDATVNTHGDESVKLWAVDFELAKTGTAAFDIGQMAAEIACIARFRAGDNGAAMLESFLRAYKNKRKTDPAKVAIRVGAHWVTMGQMGWGQVAGEEGVKSLVADGIRLIRAGWAVDTNFLRQSVVRALYDP